MSEHDGGSSWAAEEKQSTIAKVEHIISVIDAEVAAYGYYPHNRKRLTKVHALARAKVSTSTLKNATHKETKDRFNKWLKAIRNKLKKREAGAVDFDKVNSLRSALEAVASELHLMKLEHNELLYRLAQLESENVSIAKRNSELTTELAELRAGGANIYPIRK